MHTPVDMLEIFSFSIINQWEIGYAPVLPIANATGAGSQCKGMTASRKNPAEESGPPDRYNLCSQYTLQPAM